MDFEERIFWVIIALLVVVAIIILKVGSLARRIERLEERKTR